MAVEVPVFNKCCMCIPLRYGLLFWGYIKLLASIVAIGMLSYEAIMIHEMYEYNFVSLDLLITVGVIITLLIVDVAFCVTFICGGHEKKVRLLKIYYVYCMVLLVLMALAFVGLIVMGIIAQINQQREINGLIQSKAATGLLNMVFHLYFIFLLRSEILKLNNYTVNAQRIPEIDEENMFNSNFLVKVKVAEDNMKNEYQNNFNGKFTNI